MFTILMNYKYIWYNINYYHDQRYTLGISLIVIITLWCVLWSYTRMYLVYDLRLCMTKAISDNQLTKEKIKPIRLHILLLQWWTSNEAMKIKLARSNFGTRRTIIKKNSNGATDLRYVHRINTIIHFYFLFLIYFVLLWLYGMASTALPHEAQTVWYAVHVFLLSR